MKKILMTLATCFVAVSMSAQYYVGGTLGFNSSKDKTNPAAELSTSSFRINPEIGMALDDKLGVGIVLGFGYTNNKVENTTANPTTSTEAKVTTFAIKPYLRYQCFTAGKFNVFVDGGLNFATQSQKDMKAAMDFGLFVSPGIAYNVNETWSIVAHLNDMFTFGYSKQAIPDVDGAPDAPSSISAGLSTGGFTLGSLTFGVYYNF